MNRPVVWVHGDCLSPHGPALTACPGAPALFVFDDVAIERYRIGLKRLGFMYECLLELPVTIRRGDPAAEVDVFVAEHGADGVVTTWSPAPRFAELAARIEAAVPLVVLREAPFVPDRRYDLGRFSRYWRDAARFAMSGTPDGAEAGTGAPGDAYPRQISF